MTTKLRAWKACNRHKRFPSSNLGHSARNASIGGVSPDLAEGGEKWRNAAESGKKTAKKPQKNRKRKMRKVRVSLYYRGGYLDSEGTAPLCIAVNHASSSCYIPLLGIRITPDQWDNVRKRVVSHPRADVFNSVAASSLGRANDAIMHMMNEGGVRGLTTMQVRDMIAERLYPVDLTDATVMEVLEMYCGLCRRPSTADKFKQTMLHLRRWLGGAVSRLQFGDISPEWLSAFDTYLVTYCPQVNSRAIHLRNIRTVFNYALSMELTTARYPFRQYKIKTAPTVPRALTLEQIRALWNYTPATDAQRYWHDIWRIIFALIGINMADLCALVQVSQGRVNYTRRKTGRLYSVKVEPCALRLIKLHAGEQHLVDVLERCKSVHTATSTCNKHMKAIAAELGLPPLSTYTARYSWATLAASLDVPIEVISLALGHTYGQSVTLGYIMPDRRKVDEANRVVLGAVGV